MGLKGENGRSETPNKGNVERKTLGKIKELEGSTGNLRRCWKPALSVVPPSLGKITQGYPLCTRDWGLLDEQRHEL